VAQRHFHRFLSFELGKIISTKSIIVVPVVKLSDGNAITLSYMLSERVITIFMLKGIYVYIKNMPKKKSIFKLLKKGRGYYGTISVC